MTLSRNVLNYLKEGKTLEEACAKAGVVSNELNIWKLWADKGLQPYADFFREIKKQRWMFQVRKTAIKRGKLNKKRIDFNLFF